ncbi:hypothetical protein MVEN_01303000 [Mycena venus]|uniref:Uncharacterized protein n=1 Tax=Mycena venus TaxID=2733690 RepID=A0A8H6XXE8_9AGAR|nr:hypothetical protein MVEN_01303000 [Mycena venus]
MSDPTLCRGKDAEGNQCICMRAKETYIEEETNRILCKNCNHIESAHPEPKPSVGAFVKGFRDAARLGSSSSTAKASQEEAEAETSAGLRLKKRKSDTTTDTEPPSKKSGKSTKAKDKSAPTEEDGDRVNFGKLVFLAGGISSDGTLRDPKAPPPADMEKMRHRGLVVLSKPNDPLYVCRTWSNKKLNSKIKQWLPQPIRFCERHPYPPDADAEPEIKKQLWMACIKHGKNLSIAADTLPTGVEIIDHIKIPGRGPMDRVLFLASKVRIPTRRQDWQDSESEDLGSDIDTVPSEDIVKTPQRPSRKGKGKMNIKEEPKSEPEVSEGEPDTRKAAKMRTRLSTGTLTRAPLFIPDSEEPVGGPSGSFGRDIVVVSDDDDLPPLPWVVAPSQAKSPSPAPSFAPLSPNQDPPSFFDDHVYSSFSAPDALPANTGAPVASSSGSSSLAPAAPSLFTASFTTWAGAALNPDNGAETVIPLAAPAPAPAPVPAPSTSRFKKMGRGRG